MTIKTFALGGDLTINRLGFGAMRLVADSVDGPPRDPGTGIAVLRRAVELGVNHIDTAGFYRRGAVQANELIRRALSPYRDDLVIASKVGPLPTPDGVLSGHARPDQLRSLVEADLRSLGLDWLDLVYLRADGMTEPAGGSIAERFAVLAELREQGLIRHLGVSNVNAAQLAEAQEIAPVAAVQNRYADDVGLLAECEDAGIAYVPYFPLGGGVSPLDAERLSAIAARLGATAVQVHLASLLAISPSLLAIPGTGSLDHLEENVAANDLSLDDGEADPVTPSR
ncbi:oxidoreductase [Saccharopolyspora sp. WRP15-2]|uniref:Oxidoreductase n=1 Tax=Saccharopolyspora oryzae TaxID=2997343 RepID=A0ABT4V6R1_9PSEU|nr:oxidoreductase [Saccharopolyspora oryzae]MDA3628967.1 oxidoreductase [Saccharopolyspora oryzae]